MSLHENAWRRRIGVLGRSRTEAGRHSRRSHPRFGQHATLPASLSGLPCVLVAAYREKP
jgi:hypothetical protein